MGEKIKVTDEMVERARNTAWMKRSNISPTMMRQALEAALNLVEPDVLVGAGITEQMIMEAWKESQKWRWDRTGAWEHGISSDDIARLFRAAFGSKCPGDPTAALNPPPEPVIVVTEEMLKAGLSAHHAAMQTDEPNTVIGVFHPVAIKALYRAMYRARPSHTQPKSMRLHGGAWTHRRRGDAEAATVGPSALYAHRRKDD